MYYKVIIPGVIGLAVILVLIGFLLSWRNSPSTTKSVSSQTTKSDLDSIPSSAKSAPAVLPPLVAISASDSALVARINELSKQVAALQHFDTKADNLEKQIDDLNARLSKLESPQSYSLTSPSPAASTTTIAAASSIKGSFYIYALGYGGNTPNMDWTEISTISISFDPANYPGYKSLQLEAYMHVKDGNGKAFARLYSSGTAAIASETTSTNYQDEWVSGGTFTWNSKSTFTIQLKSLTGYDAYLSNARLKINF